MSNDLYLMGLLEVQELRPEQWKVLEDLDRSIRGRLSQLEGNPIFFYGGSIGKGTIISERFDLDIVVYWPMDTKFTIEGIYNGVGVQLEKDWSIQSKTVAWEISFKDNFHVDVVPGRAIDARYFETNLYRTDTETRLKTSLKTHISIVRNSGRRNVIRLLKLWRERRNVPFRKSFLLEMMVIEACKGMSTSTLEQQTLRALRYISDKIETIQVIDPANTNNSLSDDLTLEQKNAIKKSADFALQAEFWSNVFE